jgi:uncharacterized surface protein with fasciclin (FAS1) repeats
MKKFFLFSVAITIALCATQYTHAQSKTVVDVAVSNYSLKTLVNALTLAQRVDSLKAAGPFTVFAPTDDAFSKLTAGTMEELTKPENKEKLGAILDYHIVPGKLAMQDLLTAIRKGSGVAKFKTVNQKELSFGFENGKLKITDENGSVSTVTLSELKADNGFVYVIDTVLLPK